MERKLHTAYLLESKGLAIRRGWGLHKNGPGVGQILQEFRSVTLETKQLTGEGDLGSMLSTIYFDKLCFPHVHTPCFVCPLPISWVILEIKPRASHLLINNSSPELQPVASGVHCMRR